MFFVHLFVTILFAHVAAASSLTDADIDQQITRHRQSTSFKKFCDNDKASSRHVYYQFLAWWQQERVKESLDSMGTLTYALLTRAAGFGGWSKTKTASKDESTIFKNAGFLYYWDQYEGQVPTDGPKGVAELLKDAKSASLQKQFLLLPHYWLYPLHLRVAPGTEPWDIGSWLDKVRSKGWKPDTVAIDKFIEKNIFGIDEKQNFGQVLRSNLDRQGDLVEEQVLTQSSLLFGTAAGHLSKGGIIHFYLPSLEEWKGMATQYGEAIRSGTLQQSASLSLERKMSSNLQSVVDDNHKYFAFVGLAHFLRTFDPINNDVLNHFKQINTMQFFYSSFFNYKLIQLNQWEKNKTCLDLFKDEYKKKARQKLLVEPDRPIGFPYELVYQSIFCETFEDDVLEQALGVLDPQLRYTTYDPKDASPQALQERCRLVQDFFAKVHDLGKKTEWEITTPGRILGQDFQKGRVISSAQMYWRQMEFDVQRFVLELLNYDLILGDPHVSLDDIKSIALYESLYQVRIDCKNGSLPICSLNKEEFSVIAYVYRLCPKFYKEVLPGVAFLREIIDEKSPYNMAAPDQKQCISNKNRAVDYLIYKGHIPTHNKLAVMLYLYHQGLI